MHSFADPTGKLDATFKNIYREHPDIKATHSFADVPTENLDTDKTYTDLVLAASAMELRSLEFVGESDATADFYKEVVKELRAKDINISSDGVRYYFEDVQKLVDEEGNPALTSGMTKLREFEGQQINLALAA